MRQSVSKCCSWHSLHSPRAAKTKAVHEPFVAATPATYRDISRHVAALSEFGLRFLNGRRRSVNRKVRSSNLRPGANFRIRQRHASLYGRGCIQQELQQRGPESTTRQLSPAAGRIQIHGSKPADEAPCDA